MVRYKRYKRRGYRRGSTGVIKMKFQSFMDVSTTDESMQIITVSAGGPEVLKRLAPQFSAYKYYKLGNVAVKLVPASTLPVDPTGLSYEAGEQTVDPRDQLTPGLMRITNGEDIFEDLSGLTDAEQHALYNNMLLDPRWFKWMLQGGVKRHGSPRYFTIGELHQDKWPGAIVNYPLLDDTDNNALLGTGAFASRMAKTGYAVQGSVIGGSSPYGFIQTGHTGRLGWLPTDGLQPINNLVSTENVPLIASPPEVEMFKIILPKAYKTKYYYRMFITETVYFKSPIVNFGIADGGLLYRPLDVFHIPGYPSAALPDDGFPDSFPRDSETGGNYGNS